MVGTLDQFISATPPLTEMAQSNHISAVNLLAWCALQHGYTEPDGFAVKSTARSALARLAAFAEMESWRKEALRRPRLKALIVLAPSLKEIGEDLVSSSDRKSLMRLLGEALSLYWEYDGRWDRGFAEKYSIYWDYYVPPRLRAASEEQDEIADEELVRLISLQTS